MFADTTERDAAVVQTGDVGIIGTESFIYDGSTWRNIANNGCVLSVNGHSGSTVSLNTSDIPELTNLYYTDARVDAKIVPLQAQITTNRTDIDNNTTTLSSHTDDITTLTNDAALTEVLLAVRQTDISNNATAILAEETARMADHTTAMNGVVFVGNQANSNSVRISAVEAEQTTQNTAISTLETTATALGSQVATNTADIATTQSNLANLTADDIPCFKTTGAIYGSTQDVHTIFHSSGWVSGGDISNNGDGSVTVQFGSGLLRAIDDDGGNLFFISWNLVNPLVLTDNSLNYIYIEWNGGNPQPIASTTRLSENTTFLLGRIYRSGFGLDIDISVIPKVSDHARRMINRMDETMPMKRKAMGGGSIISTAGLSFSVSEGYFWKGLSKITIPAFDSTLTQFRWYTNPNSSSFTMNNTINNTLYDNGGVTGSISNNRFGTRFIYLNNTGVCAVLLEIF